MRSSIIFAFVAGALAASAKPILKERNGSASVKDIQCCKQVMKHDDASKAFSGLLSLDGLLGNVGLGCSPLLISAASSCKSTPVICDHVYQDGLINLGCSPLSVA